MPEPAGNVASRHRLFFALWPDDELAARLDSLALAAASQIGGRPTQRATLHLTLAFLGEVGDNQLPEMVAAGERVAAAPFALHVDRLGFWPHNHLLWAGCVPVAGLQFLVGQINAALAATGHPTPASGHPFRPHLTLVRKIPGVPAQADIDRLLVDGLPEWRCTRFRLVESRLSASGPDYRTLGEFALAA